MLSIIYPDIQTIIFKYINDATLNKIKNDYSHEVYNYSNYEYIINNINEGISMISKYKKIKINLSYKLVNEKNLFIFKNNLTKLYLSNNNTITDVSLSQLTNLTTLYLSNNNTITDVSLSQLTNLTTLYLFNNNTITDVSLSQLKFCDVIR